MPNTISGNKFLVNDVSNFLALKFVRKMPYFFLLFQTVSRNPIFYFIQMLKKKKIILKKCLEDPYIYIFSSFRKKGRNIDRAELNICEGDRNTICYEKVLV